jgi:hypothetical protein
MLDRAPKRKPRIESTLPRFPWRTYSNASAPPLADREPLGHWTMRPYFRAALTICRPSKMLYDAGFCT